MACLQIRRLQEDHDAQAPPLHVQMDEVLTLRAPRNDNIMPHHDSPSREIDTLRPPPSCPPSIGEGFCPISPRPMPTRVHRSSPPPPQHSHQKRLGISRSTTMAPQQAPQAPWPHHHGGTKLATLMKKEGATGPVVAAPHRTAPAAGAKADQPGSLRGH
jgi:hypothetical protein